MKPSDQMILVQFNAELMRYMKMYAKKTATDWNSFMQWRCLDHKLFLTFLLQEQTVLYDIIWILFLEEVHNKYKNTGSIFQLYFERNIQRTIGRHIAKVEIIFFKTYRFSALS